MNQEPGGVLIKIEDEQEIRFIQKQFNSMFPFLKLEFFKKPHRNGEASAKALLYDNDRKIGECRLRHTEGSLEINDSMTVTELEQRFMQDYGLSVQVFRKSGSVWLETSATDAWTLRQQNEEGKDLSIKIR